jgi:hypothetical protein
MKIYLAARYSRRPEMCRYAQQLENLGYEVTSRWLNGTHGGRHVEFGYALAMREFDCGINLTVIGYRENVFNCHPDVFFHPTWEDFLNGFGYIQR